MQYLTDPFVIFEFSLMLGGPLVILGSLIADLILLRKGMWRGGLIAAAVANAVVTLVWVATVGVNIVAPVDASLAWLPRVGLGVLLVGALYVMPLVNVAFFVAFALVPRSRRRSAEDDAPAGGPPSALDPDARPA